MNCVVFPSPECALRYITILQLARHSFGSAVVLHVVVGEVTRTHATTVLSSIYNYFYY